MFAAVFFISLLSADAQVPAFFQSDRSDDDLRQLVTAIGRADDKAEQAAFTRLVSSQHAAGWLNLFAHAQVLERKSEEWLATRPELALKAATYARDLAPSSVQAQLLVIRSQLANPGTGAGQVFRELARAVRLCVTDFALVTQIASNIAFASVAAVLLTCFLFLLFSFFKHLRYVGHDVTLLLPSGATYWHGLVLVILLLCLPLSLRLGAVGVAMALFLPPIVHSETRERVLATVAMLVIATMPFTFGAMASLWSLPSGRARDLYDVTRGNGAPAAEQRLIEDLPRLDDASVRVALGSALLLRGEYASAKEHLTIATAKHPEQHEAWVQLGVAQFQLSDFQGAQKSFEHAVDANQNSIPALFDLSRMYFREAKHDQGNQAYNRAQALDPDRTNRLIAVSRSLGSRFLAVDVLPLKALWRAEPYPGERLQRQATEAAMSKVYSGGSYSGGLPPWVMLIVALVYAVLGWTLAIFGQRAVPALPCPRCGRPVCVHTDKELPDRSLCGQCFHTFVVNDVDTGSRITKELECIRYERRRATLLRVSSVALAGSGHILAGRTLRGLMMLGVTVSMLLVMGFATNTLPLPARWSNSDSSIIGLGIAVGGWMILSLIAAITVPTKDA